MAVLRREQMRRAEINLNATEKPLLLFFSGYARQGFDDSVGYIAVAIGISEVRIWKALAQLSDRQLVTAAKLPEGRVSVRITEKGRALVYRAYRAA